MKRDEDGRGKGAGGRGPRSARPPRTINDIGPWFSRRYDGTIAGFCPVCPLSSFSRGFSFSPRGLTLPARSPSPPFSSPSFPPSSSLLLRLLPSLLSSKRRQVGIRAAVNSPALLSALMSLLLFALLNAIRAYSVSLPPLHRAPRYHAVVLSTSSIHEVVVRARARARIYTRTDARSSSRSSVRLTRSRTSRQVHDTRAHASAHGRERNARYRAVGTARRGRSNQPQTCIRTLLCNF